MSCCLICILIDICSLHVRAVHLHFRCVHKLYCKLIIARTFGELNESYLSTFRSISHQASKQRHLYAIGPILNIVECRQ